MNINSIIELEDLFQEFPCMVEIGDENYFKTRVIDRRLFDNLISYELLFSPYQEIAEKSSLNYIRIMRSADTNRFYIGFVNLGGHVPRCEIRPVRLKEVKNFWYMENMLANHADQLSRNVIEKDIYAF